MSFFHEDELFFFTWHSRDSIKIVGWVIDPKYESLYYAYSHFFRIFDYQSATTIRLLCPQRLTDIEQGMKNFTKLATDYISANNISANATEELLIYSCFKHEMMTGDFSNFMFRPGDKALILNLARLIREDSSIFEFWSPNVNTSIVSTIAGEFHGKEDDQQSFESKYNGLSF